MAKFLKNFGLGLLLMIFSPILVALVALVMVGGLIYFVIEGAIGLVRFFMGLHFFKPLEVDLRVEAIKEKLDVAASREEQEPSPAVAPSSGPVYVQNNYYGSVPPSPSPAISQPSPNPMPLDVESQNPIPNPTQIPQTPSYPYEELTENIEDDGVERVIIRKEIDE